VTSVLWALQSALAAILILAATVRATRYDFAKRQMAWVGAIPRQLLVFISGSEILGGLGLVLPGITGRAVELTSIAAASLALVQALAFGFHVSRHEPRNASANAVVIALLVFITVGRLTVAPL
jgi:putative oxidoreductase